MEPLKMICYKHLIIRDKKKNKHLLALDGARIVSQFTQNGATIIEIDDLEKHLEQQTNIDNIMRIYQQAKINF